MPHGLAPRRRRARARAGRRAPRRAGRAARVGVREPERPDRRALELLAVGVAEVGDRAGARRCRPSTRSRSSRAVAVAPEQLGAVDVTGRGGASTASPRRALCRARSPPTFTAEYAGGRCISSPIGQLEPLGHAAGLDRARRRGRRCRRSSRAARPRGRSSAAPSGSAARAWPADQHEQQARWRTGRACPAWPTFVAARRARGAPARRRRARSRPPAWRSSRTPAGSPVSTLRAARATCRAQAARPARRVRQRRW